MEQIGATILSWFNPINAGFFLAVPGNLHLAGVASREITGTGSRQGYKGGHS